jgi:FKBP-type peptidyl-prolyl cis-trans isomerase FkpA/FKBP-type peptidyl-prolyl cis-trans isomerase FklB
MSKALPVIAAVVLGGAALVPVYYATQHPTTELGSKADKNAAPVAKISYALGYEVAKQTPPELETAAFITGFRDGHAKSLLHTPKKNYKLLIWNSKRNFNKNNLMKPKKLKPQTIVF